MASGKDNFWLKNPLKEQLPVNAVINCQVAFLG